MPAALTDPSRTVLLLVDVQPDFMRFIHNEDRIRRNCCFLANCATLLGVQVVATVQNPARFGQIDEGLTPFLSQKSIEKMRFSAIEEQLDPGHWALKDGPTHVVVAGCETHICVSQTVADLVGLKLEVVVAEDAIGSRTLDRHESGLKRIINFGASIAHSEAIVYEWMRTAEHPRFRDVLQLVKENAAT